MCRPATSLDEDLGNDWLVKLQSELLVVGAAPFRLSCENLIVHGQARAPHQLGHLAVCHAPIPPCVSRLQPAVALITVLSMPLDLYATMHCSYELDFSSPRNVSAEVFSARVLSGKTIRNRKFQCNYPEKSLLQLSRCAFQ